MGYDFNNSGIFIGWSPLFDYSSIETLHESERLPTPSGKTVTLSEDGLDVTKEATNYIISNSTKDLVDLILKVGDNDKIKIDNLSEKQKSKILKLINRHTTYELTGTKAEKAYKNATSSRISQIIDDIRNVMSAYTPINMDEQHDAADSSVLGEVEKRLTMDNPTASFVMQTQNMAGKQVIGIAAVGEKIFFANSYYFNEGIRSNDPEWLNNMLFYRKYKLGGNTYKVRSLLANINIPSDRLSEVENKLKELAEKDSDLPKSYEIQKLGFTADQSLVISGLLSAATDNAKELILSKINAGPEFAGVYIHLIMQGIKFKDIADFMTSKSIQFVVDLTKSNIFDDYSEKNTVDSVLKDVLEGPNISKYVSLASKSRLCKWLELDPSTSSRDLLEELRKKFEEGETLPYLNEVDSISFKINRYVEYFNYLVESMNNLDKDIIREFKYIYDLAKETTLLGRFLSVNQGFSTDIAGKLNFYNKIESGIRNREIFYNVSTERDFIDSVVEDKPYLKGNEEMISKIYKTAKSLKIRGDFKFEEFFRNEEYRKATIEYYNLIKGTWNIYDIITRVPHFNSLYKVFELINNFDRGLSNRFDLTFKLKYDIQSKRNLNSFSEEQLRGISSYIDEMLLIKWLENSNFEFTINAGEKFFLNGKLTEDSSDQILNLATDDGRASFKYWFEHKVIPDLKNGMIDSGYSFNIKNNKFISNLRIGETQNKFNHYNYTFYYLPINMNKRKLESDERNFNEHVSAFSKLSKYKYSGIPISDLFAYYNIIVNKNAYGEDRLTGIFEQLLLDPKVDSVIKDFYKFVGDSDYSLSEKGFTPDLDDALLKIAPIVSANDEWKSNYRFIRVYNPTTKKYDVKEKIPGNTEYTPWSPIKVLTDFDDVVYNNYYILTSPAYNEGITRLKITEKSDRDYIINALKLLVKRNSINLNIIC